MCVYSNWLPDWQSHKHNRSLIRDKIIQKEVNKWVGPNSGPHPLNTLNINKDIIQIQTICLIQREYKYKYIGNTNTKEKAQR